MTALSEHKTFFKSDLRSRVDDAKQDERDVVDFRDKRKCRACGRKSDPEAMGLTKRGHRHHIVYRSAGGPDTPENVVTICCQCHNDEHVKRTLDIEGNAEDALTFWRRESIQHPWYLWRREVAVGRFEHD